jgi:hypothetical protein
MTGCSYLYRCQVEGKAGLAFDVADKKEILHHCAKIGALQLKSSV